MVRIDTTHATAAYLGQPHRPPPVTAPEGQADAFEDTPEALPWSDDAPDDFAPDTTERPAPNPP